MKRTLLAITAAATVAIVAAATVGNAEAQRRYRGGGPSSGAIAAGVIGGLAVGAIVVGAIANSRPAYAYPAYSPQPGYVAYDGYYARGPVGCPGGFWARRPLRDQWGNVVGYSRPRFICP